MIKVAEVVFSGFPNDPRPRRESEALHNANMEVDIFCLKRENQLPRENVSGINAIRINLQRKRSGALRYIFEYAYFICAVFILLTIYHFRKRYDIIHVHNMPNILVISSLIPKLTGAKVVLDLHDPSPEIFMSDFHLKENHSLVRLMKVLEKFSIWYADLALTPNKAFKDLFVSRGCPEYKIHLIMNSPQEDVFFNPELDSKPIDKDEKFVMMFHGYVVKRHGLETAVKAIDMLRDEIPNLEFRVFGPGEYINEFKKIVKDLNLEDRVKIIGKVKLEKIAEAIRSIDLGLIPNEKNPFTNINFPTRIFEYLCLKKPVIVPFTKGISDYFDKESIFYFESGNSDDLASQILNIYRNTDLVNQTVEKGYSVYTEHAWQKEKQQLVQIFNGLINGSKKSKSQSQYQDNLNIKIKVEE